MRTNTTRKCPPSDRKFAYDEGIFDSARGAKLTKTNSFGNAQHPILHEFIMPNWTEEAYLDTHF